MKQTTRLRPLFHPGRLLVAPAALEALRASGIPVISVLLRHIAGDWGVVSNEDWQQNDLSVNAGLRLLSVYRIPDGTRIVVVTEWDRSRTTIEQLDNEVFQQAVSPTPSRVRPPASDARLTPLLWQAAQLNASR